MKNLNWVETWNCLLNKLFFSCANFHLIIQRVAIPYLTWCTHRSFTNYFLCHKLWVVNFYCNFPSNRYFFLFFFFSVHYLEAGNRALYGRIVFRPPSKPRLLFQLGKIITANGEKECLLTSRAPFWWRGFWMSRGGLLRFRKILAS